jgi:hypothetical protein
MLPCDDYGGLESYGLVGRLEDPQLHQIGHDLEGFQLKGTG